ncbi:NUDIX domain-containing protein [Pseudarcicella hirudinis]|nr:NUDIX hydrolase [Pseudarcicella hirudinis]
MTAHKNPWTKINSTEVYDNPWVKIRHEEVLKPNGEPGIYGVAHFKNKAIAVLPLDALNFTWLVGQYRYPLEDYSWEVPMGGGPLDKDSLDSAKRELKEETGMTAEKWTDLGRLHTSNSVTDEVGYLYLAEELSFGESEPDDTEILTVKKVHLSEAVEMVMSSAITDSLSIAIILKAARLKGI